MKVPSISFHVRFPPSVFEKLRTQADQHHRSIAAEILTIVEHGLAGVPAPQYAATPAPAPAPRAIVQPTSHSTFIPPPSPSSPYPKSSDYPCLNRVLKQAVSQYGTLDADGRQVVDTELVRREFDAARTSEGRLGKNRWAFSDNMQKLEAQGVAERDGSIIRVLREIP